MPAAGHRKLRTTNEILASLPQDMHAAVLSELSPISFLRGDVLCEADDEMDSVFFPDGGLLTLSIPTSSAKFVGVGLIGNEGVVGSILGFRADHLRISAASVTNGRGVTLRRFRRLCDEHPLLKEACLRYSGQLLKNVQYLSMCNAVHQSTQRLASFLLQCDDRLKGGVIPTTQVALADLLGVRRTTITDAAQELLSREVISYARGSIKILSRRDLEQVACACHAKMRITT